MVYWKQEILVGDFFVELGFAALSYCAVFLGLSF